MLNSNAATTGNKAQESKGMTGFEWKCSHFSYTNEDDMSRDVLDTDEGGQICVMCCAAFHQVMKFYYSKEIIVTASQSTHQEVAI